MTSSSSSFQIKNPEKVNKLIEVVSHPETNFKRFATSWFDVYSHEKIIVPSRKSSDQIHQRKQQQKASVTKEKVISMEDLENLLIAMFRKLEIEEGILSSKQIRELFTEFDESKDQNLNFDEFSKGLFAILTIIIDINNSESSSEEEKQQLINNYITKRRDSQKDVQFSSFIQPPDSGSNSGKSSPNISSSASIKQPSIPTSPSIPNPISNPISNTTSHSISNTTSNPISNTIIKDENQGWMKYVWYVFNSVYNLIKFLFQ